MLNRIQLELKKRKDTASLRSLKTTEGLVDFCSNDYLGLARSVELQNEFQIKLQVDAPLGSGGSRLLSGNYNGIEKLESYLSNFFSAEKALIFNTGYVANLAVFSTLPTRHDTVIYDELIHTCIKDGVNLSNAHKLSFRHNDINDLDKKLNKAQGDKFVAIESIYSMDGDEAPLVEIIKVCKKHKAYIIIDEAHSTAIIGDKGEGLVVSQDLQDEFTLRTYTFGKGVGAHGSCVVGDSIIIDYLINFARPFIYTTAMPQHSITVIHNAFEYLKKHSNLRDKLNVNIKLFKANIQQKTIKSTSPIQAVIVPTNERVQALCKTLQNKGYDVRPVMSPTVAKGSERIRICIHSYNTSTEIIGLSNIINNELRP